jgi:outer membrane lipoprotein-sorting protein
MSVNFLRRLPTSRLLLLLGALAVAGTAAALIAVTATRGAGAAPAGEPLAQAVHDALSADAPQGVTARVVFTNKLLPSGDLFGNISSALLSGASGRLWLTNDGHGRIELQSDAGDTQIVWDSSTLSVYDASSNTAYKVALPQSSAPDPTTASPGPTLDEITAALTKLATHANVSDANPDVIAGQSAFSVSVSPKANGGLFGDAQLAWAAANGVPLRLAITAKGDSSPVLELKVTDISFGAVASSDVVIPTPAGAKIVDLGAPAASGSGTDSTDKPVTGIDAVRAAVTFPLTAPASVGDLALSSARLVGKGALLTYGDGLGALVVHESAAGAGGLPAAFGALPKVSLGSVSAQELQTPLGTVLTFDSGGVSFVVGGSMTNTDAEAAAKAFA